MKSNIYSETSVAVGGKGGYYAVGKVSYTYVRGTFVGFGKMFISYFFIL